MDFCIQYVRWDFAGLALSGANAPAPPKGEPLAIHADFISLPRPLPLGEVDLRSKDGEGEPVFYTYALYSIRKRVIMQGFSLFFQDQAGQRGSFGPIGKITHQNGETFQWKCPQKTQHRLFFVRADDRPAVQDGAYDAAGAHRL